jgi:hypothetical protein
LSINKEEYSYSLERFLMPDSRLSPPIFGAVS